MAVPPYKAIRNSHIVALHVVDGRGPDALATEPSGDTVDVVLKTYHWPDTKDAVQNHLAVYAAKKKCRLAVYSSQLKRATSSRRTLQLHVLTSRRNCRNLVDDASLTS